jgi:hypothetical protein
MMTFVKTLASSCSSSLNAVSGHAASAAAFRRNRQPQKPPHLVRAQKLTPSSCYICSKCRSRYRRAGSDVFCERPPPGKKRTGGPNCTQRLPDAATQPKLRSPSLIHVMLRKIEIAIGLAAAAIAIGGSTANASARHGGGAAKRSMPRHLQSAASPHRRAVPKSHGTVTPYVVTDRNWLSTSGFKYNRPYGYWPPPQESKRLGMERAH